jgi:hypothetical protein
MSRLWQGEDGGSRRSVDTTRHPVWNDGGMYLDIRRLPARLGGTIGVWRLGKRTKPTIQGSRQ